MMSSTCRANPDVYTRRRLWGDSGGRCGRPTCRIYLFADDANVDFGELAHIIAASPKGPRGDDPVVVANADRAHHTNLILLCSNCHTIVDKEPQTFTALDIGNWKRIRTTELEVALGAPTFDSREEARVYIEGALIENRNIHANYGPQPDPYVSDSSDLWKSHARRTVVPNNRKILRTLEANRRLLSEREKLAVAEYKIHVEHFENRHVLRDFVSGTSGFPKSIENIFKGDG